MDVYINHVVVKDSRCIQFVLFLFFNFLDSKGMLNFVRSCICHKLKMIADCLGCSCEYATSCKFK